ncbi:MAG: FtsB family cell division protein [Thermodesulfobacteriota bacterium]
MERREGFVNLAFCKKNLIIYIFVFSFLAIVLLFWLTFGRHGLINLYQMQKEKERCLAILNTMREENRLLALEISRLKQDDQYFESVARKQLGLVKDNEIVYRFRKGFKGAKKGENEEKLR